MTTAAVNNGTVPGLHGRSAVTLVRANSARATVRPPNPVRGAGLSLQFTKNDILMSKEVLDQAIAVAFVHCEAAFEARPENALRQ